MSYQETAAQLRANGENCCQAVLGACCSHFQMDHETAYRISAFFGGGVRRGELCGAACGVLMALGLAYGDENNRQCGESLAFLQAFEEKFGSLVCRELAGEDKENRKKICPGLVAFSAQYLEDRFK